MKILIVDDHLLFAEGVQLVLDIHGFDCMTCGSSSAALAALLDGEIDLMLVDLNMPYENGVELIRKTKAKELPVICAMISASEDVELIRSGFEAGAAGFIPKTHDREELLLALNTIRSGGQYRPSHIEEAIDKLQSGTGMSITARQMQVLRQLVTGKTNKQIAEALNISQYTAKYHVAALLELLSAKNRTECVEKARMYHLI